MDLFQTIDRKPKGHILKVVGFVKNRQDTKKWFNKITIVELKIFLQLVIYSIMSIILVQQCARFRSNK